MITHTRSILAAGALAALSILTTSAATLYVWQGSPSPGPPYDTWANAAHDIQTAVDAAVVGDEIVVTNGLYATGGRAVGTNVLVNRVAVDKSLAVRSVNGPQFTVIQGYQVPGTTNGDGAIRCVYLTNGASLSGFTLTNGATRLSGDWNRERRGGGVWCESTSAYLTNCVIAGNSGGAAERGTLDDCTLTGNLGGAYQSTLNHCTLTGNWTDSSASGGGAFFSTLNYCTLSGNWAGYSGGGAYVCTLNHCTLTGNWAGYGGGAYGGTLNNCTLTGNSAEWGGGAYQCTLTNCVLSGNSAGLWAGGAFASSLINCTLTSNYAGGWALGNGVVVECELLNCIVCFNSGPDSGYDTFMNYCCTADPRFVNAAAGDFRLRPDSPCIDAGTNLAGLVSTDILGLPRPMDGNGDGLARFDIGAYEFNPYRFEPTLHLSGDGFWFTVRGEPGRSVRIERSPDLVNWEFAGQVPIPACGQTLIDPAATTEPRLFYRAMRVP
jgi:hypothetical protein